MALVEIFEEKAAEGREPLRLRLVRDGEDLVILQAVDRDGNEIESGNLLFFWDHGEDRVYVERASGVTDALPLMLDSEGRIEIED